MTKTITLTQLELASYKVDILNRKVIVEYTLRDSSGLVGLGGVAIFWETMPTTDSSGQPIGTLPANWFLLTTQEVNYFVTAYQRIKNVLETKFLA